MPEIRADEDFERIIQTDVKMKISDAFIMLGYKTKRIESEKRKEIFKKKANQLKTDIDTYIDSLSEIMSE